MKIELADGSALPCEWEVLLSYGLEGKQAHQVTARLKQIILIVYHLN